MAWDRGRLEQLRLVARSTPPDRRALPGRLQVPGHAFRDRPGGAPGGAKAGRAAGVDALGGTSRRGVTASQRRSTRLPPRESALKPTGRSCWRQPRRAAGEAPDGGGGRQLHPGAGAGHDSRVPVAGASHPIRAPTRPPFSARGRRPRRWWAGLWSELSRLTDAGLERGRRELNGPATGDWGSGRGPACTAGSRGAGAGGDLPALGTRARSRCATHRGAAAVRPPASDVALPPGGRWWWRPRRRGTHASCCARRAENSPRRLSGPPRFWNGAGRGDRGAACPTGACPVVLSRR
jgi:hypothetical protein